MSQKQWLQTEDYLSAFQSLERNGFGDDPGWLRELRRTAISRFRGLGFPTARRGNEEWKYTDIRPIANGSFHPLTVPTPISMNIHDLLPFTFGEVAWNRLVFVNGNYVPALSSVDSLPENVLVVPLKKAISANGDVVQEHLAQYANYDSHPFTALNTAFIHDGAFVFIPDGVIVEQPIQLLFIMTPQEPHIIAQPRILIVAGAATNATIVESYGGTSSTYSFTNAVTEIKVGPRATVYHYRIQQQSDQSFHVGTQEVVLEHGSTYASVATDLGGKLTRNNLNVLMADEECSCMLNGVYVVGDSQHIDNQVIIDHAKPHTTSRELYKGILNGQSRSVFHGSIIVRQGARKVNARQEDKNLLLSDQAEADTKPAFWIYCDDVKCGHGAACGKIDENAMFYLRSRGLDERTARNLLTRAFVTEVIDSIVYVPLRQHIDHLVMSKLQNWIGDDYTT